MRSFNDVDLHAFVDGQISPERQSGIVAHLAGNASDAARVRLWTQQNEAIRQEFTTQKPEPVPLRLTVGHILSRGTATTSAKGLDAGRPEPLRRAEPSRPVAPTRRSVHAVAGLAFVAGFAVANVADRWPRETRTHAPLGLEQRADEANVLIGRDADGPLDVAEASAVRLRHWLETRLPFNLPVPDLTGVGCMLIGARLVPGDTGPAALLVYADPAGTRISLFAERIGTGDPIVAKAIDDKGGLRWTDGTVGFVWSGEGRSAWLDRNTALLRRSVQAARSE